MSDDMDVGFGSAAINRTDPVVLFIPSVDRAGDPIDQHAWTEEALAALGKLFGGATAMPAGRGAWWDEEAEQLLHESIVVVFCLAASHQLHDPALLADLATFLRRMGREARQGEVGVVIRGSYYGLRNYDEIGDETL